MDVKSAVCLFHLASLRLCIVRLWPTAQSRMRVEHLQTLRPYAKARATDSRGRVPPLLRISCPSMIMEQPATSTDGGGGGGVLLPSNWGSLSKPKA